MRHTQNDQPDRTRTQKVLQFTAFPKSSSQKRFDFRVGTGRAEEVFNAESARILTDAMQEPGNFHNFISHGAKEGYSGHVADNMNTQLCEFMTDRERSKGLSKKRQKEFANLFVQFIKDQKEGTFIADFNLAVTDGRRGQKLFKENYHQNYPSPTNTAPLVSVKTGSVPVPLKSKIAKVGGKAVRVAPVLGWILTYNELRAEGLSISQASARASVDEVLCTELVLDVMQYGGDAYSDAMAWGIENNISRNALIDPDNPKVNISGLIKRTNPKGN